MNFTISRNALFKVISKMKGIPDRSSSMPVLTHLHVATQRDDLFISASDLEVSVRINTKAEVFDEGSVALPADPFFKIIKKMPDENISFEVEMNNWVKISAGNARFNLVGLSGKDFPEFPDPDMKEGFTIPSKILRDMLRKTLFAVSRNENMVGLCGVFAVMPGNNGNSTLCMVATDGHRLAKMETPSHKNVPDLQEGIIIPLKGGMELLRMARETNGDIELKIDKNHLSSSLPDETLVIRLLNGRFPEYRKITDNMNGIPVLSERESFGECLERIQVMAQGHSSHVSLNLSGNNYMEMRTTNHDLGDAEDSVSVQTELQEISVGFNVNYLLEGLKVMKSKSLHMILKDPQSPVLITGKEDEGFTYAVMPMRA